LLRFELPPADGEARWVVRLEREAVDAVWLQSGDWRSPVERFFEPGEAGVFPGSFVFDLPASWAGPVELELRSTGDAPRALRPQVMDAADAMDLEHYAVAASATIYASLFTIGLLALALYSAARDRLFLALFGFAAMALLALSALNGHLYQVPGLRLFAFWRSQGVAALVMLLCAAWLQMLRQYAGMDQGQVRWQGVVDGDSLALVGLVALCLLFVTGRACVVAQGHAFPFGLEVRLGLVLLVDAGRRRGLVVLVLTALAVLALAGVVLLELSMRGLGFDSVLVRYGYQLAIVGGVAILAVGLVGRIAEYRQQRDRELLARTDTERRMQREAARSE